MAFGLQINTSGGEANTLDIRTPLFFGVGEQTVLESVAVGTIYYINYPSGWEDLTDNPAKSLPLIYTEWVYTGSLPDPNPEFNDQVYGNYFASLTFEDANNRLKIEITYATPADRRFTVRVYFLLGVG